MEMNIGLTVWANAETRWGLGLHEDYFPAVNSIPFAKVSILSMPSLLAVLD